MPNQHCSNITNTLKNLTQLRSQFIAAYKEGINDKTFTTAIKLQQEINTTYTALENLVPTIETKAEKFGLKKITLKPYSKAQTLIESIINHSTIDITTPAGQNQFCIEWVNDPETADLPLPCVPPFSLWQTLYPKLPTTKYPEYVDKTTGDFWYLTQLKAGAIVDCPFPQFDQASILFIDSWLETNWDDKTVNSTKNPTNLTKLKQETNSPLLNALLDDETIPLNERKRQGVVNITRQTIGTLLYEGNPSNRIHTKNHLKLLKLFCGTKFSDYEIRLLRPDEYARASITEHWGESTLSTHLDGNFLEGAARYGLYGGRRGYGGASDVNCASRAYANGRLAVRLVLARKH